MSENKSGSKNLRQLRRKHMPKESSQSIWVWVAIAIVALVAVIAVVVGLASGTDDAEATAIASTDSAVEEQLESLRTDLEQAELALTVIEATISAPTALPTETASPTPSPTFTPTLEPTAEITSEVTPETTGDASIEVSEEAIVGETTESIFAITGVVGDRGLVVRSAPDIEAEIVTSIRPAATVVILEFITTDDLVYTNWVRFSFGDVEGYVWLNAFTPESQTSIQAAAANNTIPSSHR